MCSERIEKASEAQGGEPQETQSLVLAGEWGGRGSRGWGGRCRPRSVGCIVGHMRDFCCFLRIRQKHWMVWNRRVTSPDLHFKDYFSHSLIKGLIQQMFMEDASYGPGMVLGAWLTWGTLGVLVRTVGMFEKHPGRKKAFLGIFVLW